jgi:hypothetical protein
MRYGFNSVCKEKRKRLPGSDRHLKLTGHKKTLLGVMAPSPKTEKGVSISGGRVMTRSGGRFCGCVSNSQAPTPS